MRVFELKREITVAKPLSVVFDFFSDPHNLEAITPPWLHFNIRSLSDPAVCEGTKIQYGLRVHGLPLRWTSRISSWEPPHRFVDEQLRGPYRLWVHTHTFEARGAETFIGDHVRYAPLGGWLADRLLVRADLKRIFDYRQQRIGELLGLADCAAATH
ncbi:MAG: ligand-binding SRPBCC domain-containing protein [Pseudohongiellaceae bacterium]|jgi:ligand-binding SRPBCC domain-containing protein